MALSDNGIIGAIKTGQFHIVPRNPKLNPAGIDLRADRSLVLRPGQQKLVATIERVELSENFLGILHIRSSLAREGIVASLALVDPGFRGQLTVSLHNAGDRLVSLRKGERFIQLSLKTRDACETFIRWQISEQSGSCQESSETNDQVAQNGKRYTGYAGLKREYKQ